MNRELVDELKDLGSRLATLPKLQAFAPPEAGYFGQLAPALAQLTAADEPAAGPAFSKELQFEVPAGYLETLPEQLLHTATGFGEQSRQTPFEVPAGYFGSLPAAMLEAAREADKPKATRTLRFPRRRLGWLAAAAAAAGIWFGVSRIPTTPSADTRAQTALAGLASDSIDAYIERHADEFDTESLEASLAGSQVTDFRKVVSGLRSDEIEQYLNDDETPDGI